MFHQAYSKAECVIIRGDYANGIPARNTAITINKLPDNIERGIRRSPKAIRLQRVRMGITTRKAFGNATPISEETTSRQCDDQFQAAMNRAIREGTEHATIGVVKDDTPFVGKMIHPEPPMSCCASSSALCAELGSSSVEPSDMAFT